jgi:hypothetical protein
MTPITATFDPAKVKGVNGKAHRKEGKCHFESYSIIDPDRLWGRPNEDGGGQEAPAVIECRLYGTGARNYACIWVSKEPWGWSSGSGSAGGGGYHRPSAAAQEAIDNAGFSLSRPIDGRGPSAIVEALFAIAKVIGVTKPILFHAHP